MAPTNHFLFSTKYRVPRHIVYWCCYILVWAVFWTLVGGTYLSNVGKMLIWLPAFTLYSYPVAYLIVPKLLLKNHYFAFIGAILLWGVFGWYLNIVYRGHIFFPIAELVHIPHGTFLAEPASFLCLTTNAGSMSVSSLTKRWVKKQQEMQRLEQEKITAQLQLLKAQLHPHFLFNTLNNIYSFALERSPKTPQLVLQLSSLLSYMLYECKSDEVQLSKEVEVMKNYIDLEKERYGDKIDISVNIEGEIRDKFITPLLILPFLENAFKHGTSEQIDRPWLSIDIAVRESLLQCKVVNSKNEFVPFSESGVGIDNVKKRLALLYPDRHELKLVDEGNFFVVSLQLQMKTELRPATRKLAGIKTNEHESALSAN